MIQKPQFSLSFLFFETFLIAVGLGAIRLGYVLNGDIGLELFVGITAGLMSIGAAIGGIFDRFAVGGIVGAIIGLALQFPAVNLAR